MEKKYWMDVLDATKMGNYLKLKEKEFINSTLDKHNIKNCLDVGCGAGRFTIPIYQRGIDTTGLDIDVSALNLLKKKGPNIKTLQCNIMEGLPFENSVFDCIISIEVPDYLPDINKFFEECNRVLKVGGLLLFTISNKNSYKKYMHSIIGTQKLAYRFSFKDIQLLIEENGFKTEKAYGFNWIPFNRSSNSKFIPIFGLIEDKMKLKNIPGISPWVFFIIKKEK